MNKIKELFASKKFLITYLFIIVGILITLINLVPNDFWWHVKAGEYMIENKVIPYTDVFSWYGIENNLYWHSHEWLSEVLMYLIYKFFNAYGITIFIAILMSSTFVCLYKYNKKLFEEHFGFTLIWCAIGFFIFITLISPRPHMISFLLFAMTIGILYKYRKNENSKLIWALPFISLLWVNFHGGSSNLPYVLILIFVITGLFDFSIGKLKFDKISKNQRKTYLIVALLCFIALFINPHGIDMITYPYANMNDKVMLSFIGEWQSPNIKSISHIVYIMPIIVSVLIFIKTKKDILFIDLTMVGAFSYLTLKSIRFSAFLYMASSFVIFNYLSDIKIYEIKNKTIKELQLLLPKAINRLYILFTGIITVFLLLTITANPVKIAFESDIISKEVIETIKRENPKKLFNDYNYGGYLIFNDIKPLIDGRADMYSKTLLKDYINYTNLYNTKLEKRYEFDYLLVDKDLTLDNIFSTQPENYQKLAEDKRCVLYKNLNYSEK